MNIELRNCDCLKYMMTMGNDSVNAIITDPPYKYLKNQKLEVDFDEVIFFREVKRVLKDDGFIVLFGRGTSFYRWNTMLADLGFIFKEEIIWNKNYTTSPVHPISRQHETISIHSLGGVLRKIKIPYNEARSNKDINKVIADVNRLKSVFNNEKSFDYVKSYLEGNRKDLVECRSTKYGTSCQTKALGSQTVSPMIAIKEGMKPKSIMHVNREHYTSIHPTQKPIALLHQLIKLTTDSNDVILDPFAGSCSTGIAANNLNRNFVGCEIDLEYYEAAKERIKTDLKSDLFNNLAPVFYP